MGLGIRTYTKDRIPDVLDFERRLRGEEDFWGWEIDQAYVSAVEKSFDDRSFDGSKRAYLDWICVIDSVMRDVGVWIDIK